MAQMGKRVTEIIIEEAQRFPERCQGYQEAMLETLAEIIELERQHRLQGINIQQKIGDKCSATARFLLKGKQKEQHGEPRK